VATPTRGYSRYSHAKADYGSSRKVAGVKCSPEYFRSSCQTPNDLSLVQIRYDRLPAYVQRRNPRAWGSAAKNTL
jgi:hypothetical protein